MCIRDSGWSALWNGTNVTLTLGSGVHGLVPGAVVSVTDSGTPTSIFVGSFTVNTVPAPNQISYDQFSSSLGTSSVTATGLSVSIAWPVPDDTMMPTYFEAVSYTHLVAGLTDYDILFSAEVSPVSGLRIPALPDWGGNNRDDGVVHRNTRKLQRHSCWLSHTGSEEGVEMISKRGYFHGYRRCSTGDVYKRQR